MSWMQLGPYTSQKCLKRRKLVEGTILWRFVDNLASSIKVSVHDNGLIFFIIHALV